MKDEGERVSFEAEQSLKVSDEVSTLRETIVRYVIADPADLEGASTGLLAFAADEGLELFEPYDGALMASQETWDENYLSEVKEQLLHVNFSRERFDHFVDVATTVQSVDVPSVKARRSIHWISIGIVLFLCILGALVLAGPQVFRDIFQNSPLMGGG